MQSARNILRNAPVESGVAAAWTKLQLWARENKPIAIGGAAVLCLLLWGLSSSTNTSASNDPVADLATSDPAGLTGEDPTGSTEKSGTPERPRSDVQRYTPTTYGVGVWLKATDAGPMVTRVSSGSSAAEKGLRSGDVLIQVDGYATVGQSVSAVFDLFRAKETVEVVLLRDGRETKAALEHGSYPHWNIGFYKVNSPSVAPTESFPEELQSAIKYAVAGKSRAARELLESVRPDRSTDSMFHLAEGYCQLVRIDLIGHSATQVPAGSFSDRSPFQEMAEKLRTAVELDASLEPVAARLLAHELTSQLVRSARAGRPLIEYPDDFEVQVDVDSSHTHVGAWAVAADLAYEFDPLVGRDYLGRLMAARDELIRAKHYGSAARLEHYIACWACPYRHSVIYGLRLLHEIMSLSEEETHTKRVVGAFICYVKASTENINRLFDQVSDRDGIVSPDPYNGFAAELMRRNPELLAVARRYFGIHSEEEPRNLSPKETYLLHVETFGNLQPEDFVRTLVPDIQGQYSRAARHFLADQPRLRMFALAAYSQGLDLNGLLTSLHAVSVKGPNGRHYVCLRASHAMRSPAPMIAPLVLAKPEAVLDRDRIEALGLLGGQVVAVVDEIEDGRFLIRDSNLLRVMSSN